MPTINVIIPVWNRANRVGRAIESAVSQSLPSRWAIGVFVVDDGSTDDLTPALKPFGNRVSLLRHPRNLGAAAARNTGIAAADGDYVAFLDSDDTWLAGKLSRQIEVMQANDWNASCTAYQLSRPGRREIVSPLYRTGALALADVVWGCFVSPGSTLLVRRPVANEIGLLDTSLRRLEDWDWLLRYARKYRLGFLAEPLAQIEPSPSPKVSDVNAALEIIRDRYIDTLAPADLRHFLAGIDIASAAAHYRGHDWPAAMFALARSMSRAPIRNPALSAVLHNWRAWT